MQRKLGKTILFVSHDIDEAVKMGDKVALFRDGRLEQFDSPDNVLAHPANEFVADFVGRDRTLKRLPLARAADVLDRDAPRVYARDTLDQAARIMRESWHQHLAAPDASGAIPGVGGGRREIVTAAGRRGGVWDGEVSWVGVTFKK